ncbi:cation:proton antiporter [Gluconobacter wancherniae]|uniref:Sodium:proton antiporter n=1 Tax=Gluconobacter wancherniae NBRC 103581 TaxID=656744 RepID=A0A511AYY1_9PROT|nr:cation:proton antiporter [Gluconobacter wancherniae]MBF0853568.1 cyclic nucleotide-binding domain-containing protein [Gluconobacter wancherniae]MBS1063209.1 cation:proton antiporter [Gluconobacter wancherniae]MBS1094058.1 cation:proton antiporter [Gluconobacter wancherniae]GBD55686.1 sodium:proton antiporter [Gluconobacter wancherniae NBRC 103581]GBR66295.1 Na+/H+ antiporter [Gluconobacter wancherniae NBRC 103581]
MMVTGLAAVILALAFLLTLVSLIQPLAKRLEISETVLIAIVGIVLGGAASLIVRSSATDLLDGAAEALIYFPINSEGFLLIFLPILVFQGAMAIDVRRLAHETATVLLLAVVAVVVSTATIGLALYPFAQQSMVACLLLGSIVATTDPSAVAGIFREIGAASRLTRLVEGEALLNDAAAIAIFSILLAAVTSHHQIHLGDAVIDFATAFGGAIVVGVALGRLTLLMIAGLGGAPAAEMSLTLALPYAVYILCDEMLGFSGVVATAAAGLTVSAYGPSTFRPQVWRSVNEMWEQLVFWAGSLVFILAAMLVPRLLIGMTRWDCVLILIATAAGLIARGAVVFGLLPILAFTKLSPPVPNPFKATMVWGGLRGAITLALALAVTENQRVSSPVAHFIGIIATGFVLITLLVNGTTLRSLVLFLKLDRLSPIDEAMRHQVLAIGLTEVAERTRELSNELGFSEQTRAGVINRLEKRAEKEREANDFEAALGDRNRVTIALITIANQERSLLLDLFRIQGLSRRVMETLLRTAEAMADGARLEGRYGYVRALKKRLQPTWRFRIAQELHSRLHIDEPLMYCMMERFEMLIIAHLVSLSLMRFVRQRMEPTLGPRITEIVSEVLGRQRKLLDDALETLRLHYSGYSEALESRILRQIALRLEDEEYDALQSDNLISEELHRELHRDIERHRARLDTPLRFNLKSGIEQRLRAFPAFNGVPDNVLHELSRKVSMHFVSPGEVIFRRGRKIRTVYAQVAGLAEIHMPERDLLFGSGDLIGAASVIRKQNTSGTVRSLQFSHMLAIPRPVFERLLKDYPIVERRIIDRSRQREDGLLTAVSVRADDGSTVSSAAHDASSVLSSSQAS